MMISSPYKELTISETRDEIQGVRTIVFSAHDSKDIHYKPGQYLTLVIKGLNEEVRRCYSIVSSPALEEPLSICVKRVENGVFSRYLVDDAKPGDKVLTTGAGGFFTLPDDAEKYRQLFFFAGGSGIAPVISLVKTALHLHPQLEIILVYSSRSQKETIYYSELQQLQQKFPSSLHIEYLFSDSRHLDTARLHQMLLKRLLHKYAKADHREILFYACGPFSYMRMITFTLTEEHVPAANIRKENFYVLKPVVTKEPPDKQPHSVKLSVNGNEYAYEVRYPDTILRGAKANNIYVPYSCEVGRCGNCVAKCTKGQVWMSYNEVLTDKEIAGGLVLTCTGYAVGGDVELVI